MKCRKCGRWNQNSLPHCQYCGTPLEPDDGFYSATSPDWQSELKDTPNTFVWVDENGQPEVTRDRRDALASERTNTCSPSVPRRVNRPRSDTTSHCVA